VPAGLAFTLRRHLSFSTLERNLLCLQSEHRAADPLVALPADTGHQKPSQKQILFESLVHPGNTPSLAGG